MFELSALISTILILNSRRTRVDLRAAYEGIAVQDV